MRLLKFKIILLYAFIFIKSISISHAQNKPFLGGLTLDNLTFGKLFTAEIVCGNLPTVSWSKEFYYYDPYYIDMYVIFTSPSGQTYRVDAYYAKSFVISPSIGYNPYNCGWSPDPLSPCFDANNIDTFSYFTWEHEPMHEVPYSGKWLVRFVPQELGEWQMKTYLTYRTQTDTSQQTIYSPNSISLDSTIHIQCTASTEKTKGYIKTNRFKRNLQYQDGSDLFLIGENVFSTYSACGAKYYSGTAQLNKMIDELSSYGGNYFNFLLPTHFEPQGSNNNTESAIIRSDQNYSRKLAIDLINSYRYDYIIEHAQSKNVALKFVLLGLDWFNTNGNNHWLQNPFNYNNSSLDNCQFIDVNNSSTEDIQSFKNYLRYVIARWGYATNIVAWELIDEPDLTQQVMSTCYNYNNFLKWSELMNQYIKSIDLNRHLISVGFGDLPELSTIGKLAKSNTVDLISNNNGGFVFYDRFYSGNTCLNKDGQINFISDITKSDAYDPSVKMAYHTGNTRRWMDEDHFDRVQKIHSKDYKVYYNKPYFINSYWMHDSWQMIHFDEVKFAFLQHNASWLSLFSGSYGISSPFEGPTFMHCPFQVGNERRLTVLEHYKAIRQFSDLIVRSEVELEPLSCNLYLSTTSKTDALYITNNESIIKDDIRCVMLQEKASITFMYGWVQDKNYELYNLFKLGANYYKYSTTLDLIFKPPIIDERNLNINVKLNGTYKVTIYSITNLGISIESTSTVTTTQNLLTFSLGKLNGTFGDKAFKIELQNRSTAFMGTCSNNDYLRIGDMNGDGVDEIILNNRCNQSDGAFQILKPNYLNPTVIDIMYTLPHIGKKYDAFLDDGDEFFLKDVNPYHLGAEIILLNKNINDEDGLVVINPETGKIMNNIYHASYEFYNWTDPQDKFMMGEVGGINQNNLVMINYGYQPGIGAIKVMDLFTNDVRYLEYHDDNNQGWLDVGDKSILADINGDGKKDLVLVNTNYQSNTGALQGLDISKSNRKIIGQLNHGSDGQNFMNWLDPCDRILAGDIDNDSIDEIILINTDVTNNNDAIRIIDLEAQQNDKPIIKNTDNLFINWFNDQSKIMLANMDTVPGLDLVCFNTNNQAYQIIKIVNLINPAYTTTIINGTGSNDFTSFINSEDCQSTGYKMDSLTNKDFIVMMNRDYQTNGPMLKIFDPIQFNQHQTLITNNLYNDTFINWVNGYSPFKCGEFLPYKCVNNNLKIEDCENLFSYLLYLNLSPNPTSDYMSVELLNATSASVQNITIMDIFGREKRVNYSIESLNSISLDCSTLTPGCYSIKLTTYENLTRINKFIKY